MAKALLLNDGYYGEGLENLQYPIEVDVAAMDASGGYVEIAGKELIRIGGNEEGFDPDDEYIFFLSHEARLK